MGDSLNRFGRRLGAALIIVAVLPGAQPIGRLEVAVEGLRSGEGQLRVCLTADPDNFPNCVDDKAAITRSVPAVDPRLSFPAVPTGDYALAVVHDENANAKLDTFVGVPREGIGFSRNPAIRFRAPAFADVLFPIEREQAEQSVRMRYFL